MKKQRFLFSLLMALFMMAISPMKSWADIASGTDGGCTWVIDDDGKMTISPKTDGNGTLNNMAYTSYRGWDKNKTSIKTVVFTEGVNATSLKNLFNGCSNLTSVDFTNLNTENVTDMASLFSSCKNLTSIVWGDFNTENVTEMASVFYGCSKLESLDLSKFNTENVTTMSSMFYGCSKLQSLNLSNWNTVNLTRMVSMFRGCSSLVSLDLSHFNTQNVTSMGSMFRECSGLTSLIVSNFNTANVTDMSYMFSECSGLTSLSLSNFNTANVTNMDHMFYYCYTLKTLDLSTFNTEKVTNMASMFGGCYGLTSLNVANLNTSRVTNMASMFSGCSGLTSLSLSNWNTQNVKDMRNMFNNCSNLESLDVRTLVTSSVTTMERMFYGCSKLQSLNLSNRNTENLTNMSYMFYQCSSLRAIELNHFNTPNLTNMNNVFSSCTSLYLIRFGDDFNTSNVTEMEGLFSGCTALETLDLSKFNTAKVTNMASMFKDCSGLKTLDVSKFNTANVEYMNYMFSGCSALQTLDLSNFNTEKVTNMSNMFYNSTGLKTIDLSSFNTENVTDMRYMFAYCSQLQTLDLSSFNTVNVKNMEVMFFQCEKLASLTIDKFTMESVPYSVQQMFQGVEEPITVTLKSLPLLKDYTFNSLARQPGVTINYVLDENSVVYAGEKTNYLPDATSCNHYLKDEDGVCKVCHGILAPMVDNDRFYIIDSATKLAWIADKVNNQNSTFKNISAKLTADIDLSSLPGNWTPIGNENAKFMGTFDGQGHSITGMKIENYTTSYQGLFGWVEGTSSSSSSRAVLKNFSLSGTMTSSTDGPDYIGGVVGRCADYVTLNDIINNVNITIAAGVKQNHMGGVAGWCKGTNINRCTNNGNIDAGATSNCVAGIAGYATTTTNISYCLNTGTITSTSDNAYISGILGYINNANFGGVQYSLNTGSIKGGSADTEAGAIIGRYGQNSTNKGGKANYYLEGSATKPYGYKPEAATDDLNSIITPVTAEQLASGEICYYLNGSSTNSFSTYVTWYQHLGTDAIPTLQSKEDAFVYKVYHYDCNNTNIGYTYSNATQSVTDLHVFADGICTVCKKGYILHQGTDGTCTWIIDRNNNLIISPTDGLAGVLGADSKRGWRTYGTDIVSVEIKQGVSGTDLRSLFENLTKIVSIDLTNLNTSNATNMANLFNSCHKLTDINFGDNFNTANVTSMYRMFANCQSLTSIDLSDFNTANVQSISGMFYDCLKLKSLDLTSFNTANVKYMDEVFYSCKELQTINFGDNFTTDIVETMHEMFFDCWDLQTLDLSTFNTANVLTMQQFLDFCFQLETLTIDKFDMQKMDDKASLALVIKCPRLKTINMKSIPYLKDNTFNTQLEGDGLTINYLLDDNSEIYTGTNYLPNTGKSTASYTREMSNEWGTVVVPFDITYEADNENYKLYQLTGVTGADLTVTEYDNEAVIPAGTPMAVKAIGTKNASDKYVVTITGAGTINTDITPTAAVDGLTMNGTYAALCGQTGKYFIAQNKFWMAEDPITIAPFRAWFEGGITSAKSFNIVMDNETVGVVGVSTDDNMPNGKYVENHRVVVVKNGKKFNLNGQEIK